MKEETIVHIGGSGFGSILIGMGIYYDRHGYLYPGLLWFITNIIFLRYGERVFDPIFSHKSPLFPIFFMAIPAFVMGLIVLYTTYDYNHQLIRLLTICVILVDIIHLGQSNYKLLLVFLFGLWLVRAVRSVHYDDLHPNIPTDWDRVEKADILYIVPNYYGVPITSSPDYIQRLKSLQAKGKQLAMHGVEHRPEGFTIQAEFGRPLSKEYIHSGIRIFTEAFGSPPTRFKAPCYNLHPKNREILEEAGIQVDGPNTLFFNKLYHPDLNIPLWICNRLTSIL